MYSSYSHAYVELNCRQRRCALNNNLTSALLVANHRLYLYTRVADCDWHYQQADCLAGAKYNNTCRMASPGYPGLYPPNRKCRYHVAIQSPFQPLTLQFTSVQLPPQYVMCNTIAFVYLSSPLLLQTVRDGQCTSIRQRPFTLDFMRSADAPIDHTRT